MSDTPQEPYYVVTYVNSKGEEVTESIEADNIYMDGGSASFVENKVTVEFVKNPLRIKRVG